ncbi:hypothetical protein O181_065377 [Austropuccinia psidii MF-1]|uniref:Uncharacterized protein n=1 Tax=Austropuccinia psidii MF-1 TaxID=1389203 RepID=A0A9Q3EXB5_9BASI|nr:hypothetical protein [Austropuccinia psidii MF-1]
MDLTLELNTRYHARHKANNNPQEKNTESSKSKASHNQTLSSSVNKKKNYRVTKRDKPHSSLLNRDQKLIGSEKKKNQGGLVRLFWWEE